MKLFRFRSLIGSLTCTTMILACASTPPATFYTLSAMDTGIVASRSESLPSNIAISVGPISLPDFLDRPQIITRTGRNTLQLAEFHRWAGSLQREFERVICENLAILLETDHIFLYRQQRTLPINYNVTLNIKHFEGTRGGEVVLNVDWILTDHRQDGRVVVKNSIIRTNTSSSQYQELVAKQSEAAAILAEQIAAAISNKN